MAAAVRDPPGHLLGPPPPTPLQPSSLHSGFVSLLEEGASEALMCVWGREDSWGGGGGGGVPGWRRPPRARGRTGVAMGPRVVAARGPRAASRWGASREDEAGESDAPPRPHPELFAPSRLLGWGVRITAPPRARVSAERRSDPGSRPSACTRPQTGCFLREAGRVCAPGARGWPRRPSTVAAASPQPHQGTG